MNINISEVAFETFYIYLPAMVANMAPVLVNKMNVLNWLNKPLDFGIIWNGNRLLGAHKTMRGVVVGTVCAGFIASLQALLFSHLPYIDALTSFGIGSAIGAGALAGDAIKSFCKRRLQILPGTVWAPFDQIDFVLGATVIALLFVQIPIHVAVFAIVVIGFASYVVSYVGVALHIKQSL